jgi:hypothetical protein
LFVIGVYGPTSFGGVYSEALWVVYFGILAMIFGLLIVQKRGLGSNALCVNSILLIGSIFAATIFSPFPDYRWGGLLGFALLAIMLMVNLHDVDTRSSLHDIFLFANVVNVVAGFAIFAGVPAVREFFVDHYSAFYPELVEYMTSVGKPVLTFGTHSFAAFFFYLFFWLNFETYKIRKKKIYLLLALCYVALGVLLISVTGLILMAVAVGQVTVLFIRRRPGLAVVSFLIVLGVVAIWWRNNPIDIEDLKGVSKGAVEVATSPTSGFLGRFSQMGTMYPTVKYLERRPWSPIGVGFRDDLFVGDCGPVEYFLRGSVFLLLSIYIGLFYFLRNNLVSRSDARFLFFLILSFEIGMTSLTHIRTLYILPVVMVYMNELRRSQEYPAVDPAIEFGGQHALA